MMIFIFYPPPNSIYYSCAIAMSTFYSIFINGSGNDFKVMYSE